MNMRMLTKDKKLVALANVLEKYQNRWVAFDSSGLKVLASGKTIKDVENSLKKTKINASRLSYVNEFGAFLSPNAFV